MHSRTLKRLTLILVILTLALLASSSSGSGHLSNSASFSATGTLIQYRSFSGASYQLHAFDGRYVRYALPDSWLGSQGLPAEEINQLVDLTDVAYAHLIELLPAEPQGSGLLTIAVVNVGQADGLGLNGAKGVEISPTQLSTVQQSLRVGQLSETILHEICHNADLFNHYLGYYEDWRHAWTTFLIPYLQSYLQTGSLQFSAPDLLNAKIIQYTDRWEKLGAAATWERCVRDQACTGIRANEAWAGFMLRYARLHGPASIIRALSYLKAYQDSHPSPPTAAEEKNDLLIKALAYGAGANITCEVNVWKWSLTQTTRDELARSYPASSKCNDADRDTFSPLTGDNNDEDQNINPGRPEVSNNIDDDCDEIADDILLRETIDFPSLPSESSPNTTLPAHIIGYAEQQGQDAIIIQVQRPGLLKLKLRNRDEFHGWIALTSRDNLATNQSFYNLTIPEATFVVDRPGQWVITLTPDAGLSPNDAGGAGNYDLTVESTMPESEGVSLQITQGSVAGSLHITAAVDPAIINELRVTGIRFWAGGEGFIMTKPIAHSVSLDWQPAQAPNTPVALRAELLSGASPATPPSKPLWVDSSTGERLNFKSDLALLLRSLAPEIINYAQRATFGFEVINNGPATAENASVDISIDPALRIEGSQTTRGQFQSNGGNSLLLNIGRLAEGQRVIFNLTVTGISAREAASSTLQLSSWTTDSDASNNRQVVTMRVVGPAPTPTPTPTPMPTPEVSVQPLPIRSDNSAGATASAVGGLSRSIVAIPGVIIPALFSGPDSGGNWPTELGGFTVTIGGQAATMIALTPASGIPLMSNSYNVDFTIPETATTGASIPVTVRYHPLNLTLTTATEIQESAPAFWATNGTAVGEALAQEADTLVQITSSHPAVANNQQRVTLYASGVRRLASAGTLRVRGVTAAGQEFPLTIEYAGPQRGLPGLDQITLKLVEGLSGSGWVTLRIDGSYFSQVYLPVR